MGRWVGVGMGRWVGVGVGGCGCGGISHTVPGQVNFLILKSFKMM